MVMELRSKRCISCSLACGNMKTTTRACPCSFGYGCLYSRDWGFSGGSDGKESVCNVGVLALTPGSGSPLEKERGCLSSIPAWRIPWTEEPGGLQSMGQQGEDMTK